MRDCWYLKYINGFNFVVKTNHLSYFIGKIKKGFVVIIYFTSNQI